MATIWCVVKSWDKQPQWSMHHGTAKPEDEAIFKVTQYILISGAMLHRSGKKDLNIKVGDRIEIEIIANAHRVFNHESIDGPSPKS